MTEYQITNETIVPATAFASYIHTSGTDIADDLLDQRIDPQVNIDGRTTLGPRTRRILKKDNTVGHIALCMAGLERDLNKSSDLVINASKEKWKALEIIGETICEHLTEGDEARDLIEDINSRLPGLWEIPLPKKMWSLSGRLTVTMTIEFDDVEVEASTEEEAADALRDDLETNFPEVYDHIRSVASDCYDRDIDIDDVQVD